MRVIKLNDRAYLLVIERNNEKLELIGIKDGTDGRGWLDTKGNPINNSEEYDVLPVTQVEPGFEFDIIYDDGSITSFKV